MKTISTDGIFPIEEKVIKELKTALGNWHETINDWSNDAVAHVVFIGANNLKNTVTPPPPID